jgi:hypothetical protein
MVGRNDNINLVLIFSKLKKENSIEKKTQSN